MTCPQNPARKAAEEAARKIQKAMTTKPRQGEGGKVFKG